MFLMPTPLMVAARVSRSSSASSKLLSATGCFTVPMEAPYGPDVKILPPDEPVEISRRYQKWYAIWGVFELTAGSDPRHVIDEEELVEVRVYTEDSIEDIISGFFFDPARVASASA